MRTLHIFKPVAVMVMLATLLLPTQSVGAAGAAQIGGTAYHTGATHYGTQRYITDNDTPGASVVFTQHTGSHNLRLAAWDCFNRFEYPWGGLMHQDHNVLRDVADGVHEAPPPFCMAADTSSSTGGGSFSGYLQWD
ncbi:MAG: hypothetical protein M3439_00410 [Chloroflexota bacterium]|nr:hypothetical protein [Chloroflexota bacterium]